MATRLDIAQGASYRFSVRVVGMDFTLYDVYLQFRKAYASSPEKSVEESLIDLRLVGNVSEGNALAYGDLVSGVRDSVVVVVSAADTAKLVNQDNYQKAPSHRADMLLVLKTDSANTRIRIAEFDVYADPRVTVAS